MIEQRAKVLSVHGDRVRIQTEAQTGCHSCGAKSGCGSALIAQMFPARFNQQLRLSTAHLATRPRPGEHVIVGIDEGHLRKISLLLYAVPLLGLLGGAIAGQAWGDTELISILGGLLGLIATLASVRWGAERILAAAPEAIRILRIEHARSTAVPLDQLKLSGS